MEYTDVSRSRRKSFVLGNGLVRILSKYQQTVAEIDVRTGHVIRLDQSKFRYASVNKARHHVTLWKRGIPRSLNLLTTPESTNIDISLRAID